MHRQQHVRKFCTIFQKHPIVSAERRLHRRTMFLMRLIVGRMLGGCSDLQRCGDASVTDGTSLPLASLRFRSSDATISSDKQCTGLMLVSEADWRSVVAYVEPALNSRTLRNDLRKVALLLTLGDDDRV